MTHWTLIFIAAAANVILNLCLRQTGKAVDPSSVGTLIVSLLTTPWAWVSGISALVLVSAFVVAVRTYSLSLTYTAVTAIAMVALTAVSASLQYETVSGMRMAGLAFIVVGLAISAQAA